MPSKSFLKSWTLWFNGVITAAGAGLVTFPDLVNQPQVQQVLALLPSNTRHNVATLVTVVAALNVILRFKTKQPVTVAK